ncbi:MAG: hypothetical protein HC783_06960 [Rhodobacteraceae bacterium]|nr:hypothetical protein [Paracoccaceae bacterium]
MALAVRARRAPRRGHSARRVRARGGAGPVRDAAASGPSGPTPSPSPTGYSIDSVIDGNWQALWSALGRLILDHYDDMLTFYGTDLGLRMARKHLGWYLEEAGLPHAREAILTSTDPAEVIQLLEQAFAELELAV